MPTLSAEWIAFVVSLTALAAVHIAVPVAVSLEAHRQTQRLRTAKHLQLLPLDDHAANGRTDEAALPATYSYVLSGIFDRDAPFEAAPRVSPNIYERQNGAFGVRDGPPPRARGVVRDYITAAGYGGRAAVAVRRGRILWFEGGVPVGVEVPREPCEIVALVGDNAFGNVAVLYTTHLAINGQRMLDTLGDMGAITGISAFDRETGSICARIENGNVLCFSPLVAHTTPAGPSDET